MNDKFPSTALNLKEKKDTLNWYLKKEDVAY